MPLGKPIASSVALERRHLLLEQRARSGWWCGNRRRGSSGPHRSRPCRRRSRKVKSEVCTIGGTTASKAWAPSWATMRSARAKSAGSSGAIIATWPRCPPRRWPGWHGSGLAPAIRVPAADGVEEFAVEREGAAREIRPVERLGEEALEGLADLLQQLPEQRIVGGVVDRQVEGEVLAARRALLEVDAPPWRRACASITARSAGFGLLRRDRAGLDLEPAPHLQGLQQPVAQRAGVDRQRHVDACRPTARAAGRCRCPCAFRRCRAPGTAAAPRAPWSGRPPATASDARSVGRRSPGFSARILDELRQCARDRAGAICGRKGRKSGIKRHGIDGKRSWSFADWSDIRSSSSGSEASSLHLWSVSWLDGAV